jgi:hypothetical protein
VSALGPIELVIILVLLLLLVLPIWAIVDALLRPDSQWAAADQNKVAWVVALAVATFLLGPVGLVVAIVYLVSVRPKFRPR